MLRQFKVSKELRPYIRKILHCRHIPYHFFSEGNIQKIEVPLSGQKFHEVVMRAKSEKLTDETGILHLTKQEAENETTVAFLLKEKNQSCFVVTDSEYKKD